MKDDTRRRRRRGDRNISKKRKFIDENLESKFGFDDAFTEGEKRLGWLLTFTTSSWEDTDMQNVYSCVDLYFVRQDGSTFKVKYKFRPYFYAATKVCM
ncbi:putative DNA-directed DNA polymerase [Helianthus annuus]|nr:putative DNA-directed DNA polymerase [Helianthus annuus]KAJ0541489.1 putative DNA-directed DNA polymerase [Helianthus annuus]KAJ0706565.1 putative DNA-directed DNA polymerase [Helianthus annuus]KAJ0710603.1 putative DNA-directed DNA polymerase [Helianthus annuus]KAJ0887132.1 putative DNA-directed DNA polymerase [Helianthus annuus]